MEIMYSFLAKSTNDIGGKLALINYLEASHSESDTQMDNVYPHQGKINMPFLLAYDPIWSF